MSSLGVSRSIISILQTLQGSCSTGTLLVKSTAATGTVPAYSHAIPVINGALAEDAVIRVEKNSATSDGSWSVTSAGTAVTVTSLQGGMHVNLDADTECRWVPALTGIEETSEVRSGGLTGGARLSTVGALRQVRVYRELSQDVARDLFRAGVGEFPAAVLSWSSDSPADGSVSATYGSASSRQGKNARAFKSMWDLFLITSRLDQTAVRMREGEQLRDNVLELFTDRTAWRGRVVSMPQGIEILDARLFHVSPTSYVDLVRFSTSYTLRKTDSRTWNDWVQSSLIQRFPEDDVNDGNIDLPDILIDMDG